MTTHIELGHALLTMVEPHRETVVSYNEWFRRDHFLSGALTGPLPQMPGVIAGQPTPADVVARCCFLRAEPAAAWETLASRIRSVADPLLVAPFIPAIPGTRTYLDQLWWPNARRAHRPAQDPCGRNTWIPSRVGPVDHRPTREPP